MLLPLKLLVRLFKEATCFTFYPLLTFYLEDPEVIAIIFQSDVGDTIHLPYTYSFGKSSPLYNQIIQTIYFGIHEQFEIESNQNRVDKTSATSNFSGTMLTANLKIIPAGCIEINFVFATGQFEQFMSEMLCNQNSTFAQEATPLL